MKKILVMLLAVAMVLSLAACGGKDGAEEPEKGAEPQGSTDGDRPDDGGSEDGKQPEDSGSEGVPGGEDGADSNDTEDSENPGDLPDSPLSPAPGGEDGDETGEDGGEGDGVPGFAGPAFQFGPGGTVTPGAGGGEQEDIPVTDAGDLVDQLDAICSENVEGSFTVSLRSSGEFSNYFSGLAYTEGMRVAMNHLEMAPPAHVVMLIEVPEGEDAQAYAEKLSQNANPRWMICAMAESVQYAVKDNLVLFVMSSEEIANAVIAAFNG